MAILSYGSAISDVEVALKLSRIVKDDTDATNKLILALLAAVEATVKKLCRRNFEQTTYTDSPIDVRADRKNIWLPDRPVSIWTSIKQVLSYNTDGTVASSYTIPRSEYLLYSEDGRLTKRNGYGYWPSGPQACLISCVVGYSSTQITNNSADEIRILKKVITGMLAREWKRYEDRLHHVDSVSMTDETITLQVEPTTQEKAEIRLISAWSIDC